MIQQIQRGRLVRADGQPAGGFVAQLGHGVFQIALQVLEAAGVVQHDLAGVGQQQVFGRPVDQLLPHLSLKSLNRKGNGGLSPQQLFRRPGKTAFRGHRQEHAERVQLHKLTLYYLNLIDLPNPSPGLDNVVTEEAFYMADRVYIFDTTLRDGEQSPGCSMTVAEKLRMAAKLVELGVDILEAGFPIASQGDSEAVDAVAREFPWVSVAALARSNRGDILAAANSLKNAKRPRIHTFIATSDIHLKHKLKKSRQQVLDEAVAAVRLAREYCDDVEFSAEDATRTDPDYLEQVSRAVVAAGARTVNLPDTVGFSIPEEYRALIARIVKALGDSAVVSVHCHDDLGLAVANSLAAIQGGARQIECTINGIGERAGNAALEEVVMALNTRRDRAAVRNPHRDRASLPVQPVAHVADHLRAAAQQGDCRRERLRA